jgi:hypothetical protein
MITRCLGWIFRARLAETDPKQLFVRLVENFRNKLEAAHHKAV